MKLRPRFSLKVLMLFVAAVAIFCAYHVNWIRQRHDFLAEKVSIHFAGAAIPAKRLPWPLVLFGEQSQDMVFTSQSDADEAKRLFPESHIVIYPNLLLPER